MQAVFPEAHAAFAGFLPEPERGDLLAAYLRRLTDPDPSVHLPAARAWSVYEGTCSTLLPSPETVNGFSQDRTALGLARIEAFYFAHGLFLPADGLLGHMDQISHIPAEIVQGRYDMICPAVTAFDLAAAWRNARMTIVPDAGIRAGAGNPAGAGRGGGAVSRRPVMLPARCTSVQFGSQLYNIFQTVAWIWQRASSLNCITLFYA